MNGMRGEGRRKRRRKGKETEEWRGNTEQHSTGGHWRKGTKVRCEECRLWSQLLQGTKKGCRKAEGYRCRVAEFVIDPAQHGLDRARPREKGTDGLNDRGRGSRQENDMTEDRQGMRGGGGGCGCVCFDFREHGGRGRRGISGAAAGSGRERGRNGSRSDGCRPMEERGGEARGGEVSSLPFFLRFCTYSFVSSLPPSFFPSFLLRRRICQFRATQTFQSHDTGRAAKISTCGEIREQRGEDELMRLFAESVEVV